MPASEIALLAILFVVTIAGAGLIVDRLERGERGQRRRGLANRRRAKREQDVRCLECGAPVDPRRGAIYDRGAWWCETDWKKHFEP